MSDETWTETHQRVLEEVASVSANGPAAKAAGAALAEITRLRTDRDIWRAVALANAVKTPLTAVEPPR